MAIFTWKRNRKNMVWIRCNTKERKNKECSSKTFYGLGIVRFFLSFTGAGLIKGGKLMSSEWTLLINM